MTAPAMKALARPTRAADGDLVSTEPSHRRVAAPRRPEPSQVAAGAAPGCYPAAALGAESPPAAVCLPATPRARARVERSRGAPRCRRRPSGCPRRTHDWARKTQGVLSARLARGWRPYAVALSASATSPTGTGPIRASRPLVRLLRSRTQQRKGRNAASVSTAALAPTIDGWILEPPARSFKASPSRIRPAPIPSQPDAPCHIAMSVGPLIPATSRATLQRVQSVRLGRTFRTKPSRSTSSLRFGNRHCENRESEPMASCLPLEIEQALGAYAGYGGTVVMHCKLSAITLEAAALSLGHYALGSWPRGTANRI